jgi:hypothetical protein
MKDKGAHETPGIGQTDHTEADSARDEGKEDETTSARSVDNIP